MLMSSPKEAEHAVREIPVGTLSSQPVVEIRPIRHWLDLDLRSVWRFRELLVVLLMRDVRVLYRQAVFGIAWAIIQPVFAVIVFSIVFGRFARISSDGMPYAVFVFAAVLPWTYFAEAVRRSSTGLVNDAELVRKIYFPRLLIPLQGVTAPLIDFAFAFVVLLATMLWYGVMPTWRLLALPPMIALTGALALAVGLWLSPINARFRDIKHTLPFILQIWMYASPIVYPVSMVPDAWRWIYSLNPMVGVIEAFRWAILAKDQPELTSILISVVLTAALLLGGLVFFRRSEQSFADVI